MFLLKRASSLLAWCHMGGCVLESNWGQLHSECWRVGTQDRQEMAGGEGAVDALMVTVLVKSYTCFGLDKQLAKTLKSPHWCLGETSWTTGLVEVGDSVDVKASWNRSIWTCPSPWNCQEGLCGLVWAVWALTLGNSGGVVLEWCHWGQKDIEHHVSSMAGGNSHCFFLLPWGEGKCCKAVWKRYHDWKRLFQRL